MPNHRKSLKEHELNCSAAHNPARFKDRQPTPECSGPLGDPPAHFNDRHAAMWREIVAIMPKGVAQNADRLLLEMTCVQYVKFRDGDLEFAAELNQLMSCLARLGLSPADRNKLGVAQKDKPVDAFDFLN